MKYDSYIKNVEGRSFILQKNNIFFTWDRLAGFGQAIGGLAAARSGEEEAAQDKHRKYRHFDPFFQAGERLI